jgi:hypothetical protein
MVADHSIALDADSMQKPHDDLLQGPDILAHAQTLFLEVQNGISYELPGTMIRDTAASIGIKDSDAFKGQPLPRNDDIFFPSESS